MKKIIILSRKNGVVNLLDGATWNFQTGWSGDENELTASNCSAYNKAQVFNSLESGKNYNISFDIVFTQGQIRVIGGNVLNVLTTSTTGSYSEDFTADGVAFGIRSNNVGETLTVVITNIVLTEI